MNTDSIERLRYLLKSLQISEALQVLNALTEYRFTALYRFTPSGAANLVIFDRQAAVPAGLRTVPEGASYCGIARETKTAVVIKSSLEDARVTEHPARLAVQSYCGVPLLGRDGEAFGTLCHFDFEPRDVPPHMPELMSELARYLDTDSGLSDLAETISRSLTRLEQMGDLLHSVSPDLQSLRDIFDMYAQPVRLQAEALSLSIRDAMEARMAEIFAQLASPDSMRRPKY